MQEQVMQQAMQQNLNYDIFWRLSEYLDITSIQNLSNTCKKFKTFKCELKSCLIQRMFHKNLLIQKMTIPWIVSLKMFNCLESRFKGNSYIDKIIIFALNESLKKSNSYSKFIIQIYNTVIENSNLNDLNLSLILAHVYGNQEHVRFLIEKIFRTKILNRKFNLQHLFNTILTLQDIHFLTEFHSRFHNQHIMVTREYLRKIIISNNVLFFDTLVKLFIGDFIKLNLYQSCIKECKITLFDKYLI